MPMKYTCTIDLLVPREKVVMLFDDAANLKRWQSNLRSFERLDGLPGQVGARSKLVYKNGKREMTMTETITVRELPDRFAGTYEMPGAWYAVENRFVVVDATHTRWIADVEFRMDSLMMKLLYMVVPGMFRKQTDKMMKQFKEFAESQTDEGLERTIFEP